MKYILYTILFAASIVVTSCGSSKPTDPKDVAKSFLSAMNKADYETAKKYSTDDTRKLLDMTSSFEGNLTDSIKSYSAAKKIEIIGEPKIEIDNAVVTYKESDSPETKKLNLIKKNGQWLVQQTKDNPEASTPVSSDETAASESDEILPIAADSAKR